MLKESIEKKRKKMVYLAETYGYTSSKTLKCSQELDKLLNMFEKMNNELVNGKISQI